MNKIEEFIRKSSVSEKIIAYLDDFELKGKLWGNVNLVVPLERDSDEKLKLTFDMFAADNTLSLFDGKLSVDEFNTQITFNEGANFAPYFFPNDKRVIFCSNMADPKGRDFDLWAVNTDGTNLERITFYKGFDGFPVFSPNGKYFVFASNRNQAKRGDTNIFIAEWQN